MVDMASKRKIIRAFPPFPLVLAHELLFARTPPCPLLLLRTLPTNPLAEVLCTLLALQWPRQLGVVHVSIHIGSFLWHGTTIRPSEPLRHLEHASQILNVALVNLTLLLLHVLHLHVILAALGRNDAVAYAAGEAATMEIGVPSIDTSGFKPHQLANAGLVICTLTDGEEEVVAVNMVTQVRRFLHFSELCC